ncbi:acyl-CoA dehydrogenase family protein [Chloroflexota bacterium]
MDFSLDYTPEQEKFATEVREWIDKNVPDDLVYPAETTKMTDEDWQKRFEIRRKLGEKGWLYPEYPREFGGGGMSSDIAFVLYEELDHIRLGLTFFQEASLMAAGISACATEEQKKIYLSQICKGEVRCWQLFTEPEAGTDEANQKINALIAVPDGDDYIVNGQKTFVGALPLYPDRFWLLTRSNLDLPRHENLTMFFAPADLPGIKFEALDLFSAGHYGAFAGISGPTRPTGAGVKFSVYFEDVRVPKEYVIGEPGDGWKVVTKTLEVEHGGYGWIERNAIAAAFLDHCKNNPVVKKRLKANPELVSNVVEAYIGAQIERLFALRNLAGEGGDYGGPQLAMRFKIFGAKLSRIMTEVLGPAALTDDPRWGYEGDVIEVGVRAGICISPGGTPEASKINISRALSIGR